MEMNALVVAVVSWFILVLGASYLLQANYWAGLTRDALENPSRFFPLALWMLIVGLVVVMTHNHWGWEPRVIITAFGWLLLTKSIIYLTWTDLFTKFAAMPQHTLRVLIRVSGGGLVLLGGVLLYPALWP